MHDFPRKFLFLLARWGRGADGLAEPCARRTVAAQMRNCTRQKHLQFTAGGRTFVVRSVQSGSSPASRGEGTAEGGGGGRPAPRASLRPPITELSQTM